LGKELGGVLFLKRRIAMIGGELAERKKGFRYSRFCVMLAWLAGRDSASLGRKKEGSSSRNKKVRSGL